MDLREQQVASTLLAAGFVRNRSRASLYRFEGTLNVAHRPIDVAIEFADLEFVRPPRLFLLHPVPEIVAHLNGDGEFCYVRREQVVLDRYNPGGTTLRCLQTMREALDRSLTRRDFSEEIAREFPQHWLANLTCAIDFRGAKSGEAAIYELRRQPSPLLLLADAPHAIERFGLTPQEKALAVRGQRPAFVYRTSHTLTLPAGSKQPQTLSEFLHWAETMESGASARLWQAAVAPYPDVAALFVHGPNGCVGVTYSVSSALAQKSRAQGVLRYLHHHAETWPVTRVASERVDADFIFSRNENRRSPLLGKRIALIGAGTIGSHLAKFLVQSGAGGGTGSLIIVDSETLTAGNVGRHALGLSYWGLNKAKALKVELERSFPESTVIAHDSDAIRMLPMFDGADLVVDATGEEGLSRSVNHHFLRRREQGAAPAVLHTWLVGNGDAAQAILVNSAQHACYKCLRKDHSGDWRFWPLARDHRPEPIFGPCGDGMFMPYGVGSPAIAASLALQMVIDWAAGNAEPYFRTICINPSTTRAIKSQNVKKLDDCPACKSTQ